MTAGDYVPLSPVSKRSDVLGRSGLSTSGSSAPISKPPPHIVASEPHVNGLDRLPDGFGRSDSSGIVTSPSMADNDPAASNSLRRRRSGFIRLLPPRLADFADNNVGLLLMCLAQMFFTFMGLTVKYFLSTTEISTLTLIAVRMGITAFLCIVVMQLLGVPHPILGPPELRKLLLARGSFGFCGLLSSYQALRHLSVSDSTTIQFLTPTTTALLGWLYLGESLSWQEVAGGAMCLVGVLCVSRPPSIFGSDSTVVVRAISGPPNADSSRLVGVAWALTSVFASTLAYITIRNIGKRAHALHSMTYFASLCAIICSIALVFIPGPFVFVSSGRDLILIVIIGIFGFIAQMLLTMALQREKAGRATLASYLSLFYSLTLEFFLFHTVPPVLSVIGAAIIISSAVWVALSKPQKKSTQLAALEDEESSSLSGHPSSPPILPAARRTLRSGGSGERGRRDTDGASDPLLGVRVSEDQADDVFSDPGSKSAQETQPRSDRPPPAMSR